MLRKIICTVIVTILCITCLTGCWNRRELNEIGIVLAAAIEKDPSGEYIVTAQIVRPAALKEGSGAGKAPNELVTAKGASLFEVIRNMSQVIDRQPFFSHTKVLVLDEQIARDSITPIIHFWLNSREIRPILYVVVAKGVPARKILSELHGIEGIQANYLSSIIQNSKLNAKTVQVNLLDFVTTFTSGGTINPIAGVMELVEAPPVSALENNTGHGVKLTGTAVFKKDKLVGYLDEKETRGLNWITGKVTTGVIQVPGPTGGIVSLEIKNADTKIIAKKKDGKYVFTIQVKEESDLVEKQQRVDINQFPYLNDLNQKQQQAIETEIKDTLDKIQKEYASDIVGFGKILYDTYPDEWKEVKDQWSNLFPFAEYTVQVETKIRRPGLMQKPINPKEGPEPEIKMKGRPYDFFNVD